jgi:hypothetical protein
MPLLPGIHRAFQLRAYSTNPLAQALFFRSAVHVNGLAHLENPHCRVLPQS